MKKSLILLSIVSSIPVVYAQEEISGVFGETIQLFLSLIEDIFTTVLDALKSDPIYGKMFIAAFMGIFFYSELKQLDVFKKNIKLAGFVAVLISLIVAFGFPESVIGLLFSETTPFIGFVIAGFILLVAGDRGNWSHTARGIAFIALMMSFGAIINLFPAWAQVIIAGFVIASLVSAVYSFTRIKSSSERRVKTYPRSIEDYKTEVEEEPEERRDDEEVIERIIEDVVEANPHVNDKDIADFLTKSTGKEIKPSEVRLVKEGKPIPKKEKRKGPYKKATLDKLEKTNLSKIVEGLKKSIEKLKKIFLLDKPEYRVDEQIGDVKVIDNAIALVSEALGNITQREVELVELIKHPKLDSYLYYIYLNLRNYRDALSKIPKNSPEIAREYVKKNKAIVSYRAILVILTRDFIKKIYEL